jgi:hypothetical protein
MAAPLLLATTGGSDGIDTRTIADQAEWVSLDDLRRRMRGRCKREQAVHAELNAIDSQMAASPTSLYSCAKQPKR